MDSIVITKRGKTITITPDMLRAGNGIYKFTADQNGSGYKMTITVTEGKTPTPESFTITAQ